MNFEEFRALWEKYRDLDTPPETLNELFKKIKYLPLNKIFDVRVDILIKNIKDFFLKNYNIKAQTVISVLDLDPPIANLKVCLDGKLKLKLGELIDNDTNYEYDLTKLLGGLSRKLSSDIKKFMSYAGIEDMLWKTIKENYNSEKKKEIGLIRKRVNENLKTIEKINAPDYVKNTTADLNSEIDADNQKLQQILGTLDTID